MLTSQHCIKNSNNTKHNSPDNSCNIQQKGNEYITVYYLVSLHYLVCFRVFFFIRCTIASMCSISLLLTICSTDHLTRTQIAFDKYFQNEIKVCSTEINKENQIFTNLDTQVLTKKI